MKPKYIASVGMAGTVLVFAGIALAVVLGASSVARAQCTEEDIQRMQEIMSLEDIERICGRTDISRHPDYGERMQPGSSDFEECKRQVEELIDEDAYLRGQVDESLLTGRDRDFFEQVITKDFRGRIYDRTYDLEECTKDRSFFREGNSRLSRIVEGQSERQGRYDNCLVELERIREESSQYDVKQYSLWPKNYEKCLRYVRKEKAALRRERRKQR